METTRINHLQIFLLTFTNFTIVVEVKTPAAELFSNSENRSGCWKLSSDLIDAISQVNEQKTQWDIFANKSPEIFNRQGNKELIQKTIDSKSILIIGNLNSELEKEENLQKKEIKKKTFELFCRNQKMLIL